MYAANVNAFAGRNAISLSHCSSRYESIFWLFSVPAEALI